MKDKLFKKLVSIATVAVTATTLTVTSSGNALAADAAICAARQNS